MMIQNESACEPAIQRLASYSCRQERILIWTRRNDFPSLGAGES
jgi:hypothetical protein